MIRITTYSPKFLRSAIGGYRYFFNGQESDAEAYGQGGLAGYEFRQYDTRLGRWWGLDRKAAKYPSLSPYQFCADSPIRMVDIDGSDFVVLIDNSGKEKTITIQMSIYTASQEAFDKLLPAVEEINNITKKVTIDGVEYTLCFAINPVTPDPTVHYEYMKGKSPQELMLNNATDLARADGFYGNTFLGTIVQNNAVVQDNEKPHVIAGSTAGGKTSYMNAYEGVYFINYPKLIAHEILHMMGLDDEDDYYYYSPYGRMHYVATNTNGFYMYPISNDDIRNIVRYMFDNDGSDVDDEAKVRIEYLNNSEPIQSYSNIEVK